MKNTVVRISSLSFIAVSAFVLSCAGPQSNANTNGSSAGANASTNSGSKQDYPMLASNLADADLELPDGTFTKISEKKGKVLLVNLWAIWCGPCRGEMPHLVEMQNAFGPQGFEIVGINIGDHDGNPEPYPNINKFVESMKLNYTSTRVPLSVATQFYRVTGQNFIPQTFVIDREGRLRGAAVGGSPQQINEIRQTIQKVISE